MLNYIKWELIDYIKRNYILYLSFIIVYTLAYIVLFTNTTLFSETFKSIIIIAFIILLIFNIFCCFLKGTERTLNSFKNKTFLLESMIPLSSLKITIAKYLISIIINFSFIPLLLLGLICLMGNAGIKELFYLMKFLLLIDTDLYIFKLIFLVFCYSLTFTAISTMCFVGLKCLFPSKLNPRFGTYIVTYILLSIYNNFILLICPNNSVLLLSILLLLISIISLYITVFLITDKLEIYS